MEPCFKLTFEATRDNLMRIEKELKNFLVAKQIEELDALGVHLAFHEHCMNIIEHGCAASTDQTNEINALVDISGDVKFIRTVLVIEDCTPPFDPMSAEGDGLGICMIKAISGTINWVNKDGKNICTFVFPKLRKVR